MSQNRTSEFFNSYAHDFEAIYGNNHNHWNRFINKYFRKSMQLRYIKSIEGCFPIEGKSVIDIGCGPGHYIIVLAQKGACSVCGLDFATGMLELARQNAEKAGVLDKCNFICDDFLKVDFKEKFNYSIVMGFMDYIEEPSAVIDKVLDITTNKAFFSFPLDGGFLAWKRKLKYKNKCNLFMYKMDDLHNLFKGKNFKHIEFEQISRDIFVTVHCSEG